MIRSSVEQRWRESGWKLAAVAWGLAVVAAGGVPLGERDWTLLWWEDGPPMFHGFLEHDRAAGAYSAERGRLRLETGHYGLLLDTEGVDLPQWGLREATDGWGEEGPVSLSDLGAGGLEARIEVGGKVYELAGRVERAADPRQYAFPVRIVESGRYFQHIVLADLRFRDAEGQLLAAAARFEFQAWPDRLQVELVARWDGAAPAGPVRMTLALRTPAGEVCHAREVGVDADRRTTRTRWTWHAGEPVDGAQREGARVEAVARWAESVAVEAVLDEGLGQYWIGLPALPWGRVGGAFPERHLHDRHTVRVRLVNPGPRERVFPLLFENLQLSLTGFVPLLLDAAGEPTGLPVQISKNWHQGNAQHGEIEYVGPWSHGRALVRLEAGAEVELEYVLVHAYWAGLPSASVAQLSLIGWGFNGFWDQWALGSFGETLCLQPGRQMRRAFITDVRPVLVESFQPAKKWTWTSNVGGGDLLMLIDGEGQYLPWKQTHSRYDATGPNLPEVLYREQSANESMTAATRVLMPQSDDYVRVLFHVRLDVKKPQAFQRLAFLQMGNEYYNESEPTLVATGHRSGLAEQWPVPELVPWTEVRRPLAANGPDAWLSLHGQTPQPTARYGQATRGLIVRSWQARLGGVDAPVPYWHFQATAWSRGQRLSVLLGPPPGLTELLPGDFVDAVVEWVVQPLSAESYYGPDERFRRLLTDHANSWQPLWHAALDFQPRVEQEPGPTAWGVPIEVDLTGRTEPATFRLYNSQGTVPVRLRGLAVPAGHVLEVERAPGHYERWQPSHGGSPFWQTEYEAARETFTQTYSLPATPEGQRYRFRPATPQN